GLRDALPAADHPDDLHHIAFAQRRRCIRVAPDDGAVVLDHDRAWADAERLQISVQRRGGFELDAFAVDLEFDHWKSRMAATPAAPASWTAAMRSSLMPPIATTGIFSACATWARSSSPLGCEPGWLSLSHTGPKMTKSAPSRSACIAASSEWTERPMRRSPRIDRASRIEMSRSGRLTPAAPDASAMSHRELTITGTGEAATSSTASASSSRALRPGARSCRMVARGAAWRPARAPATTAIAIGAVNLVARRPRWASWRRPARVSACDPPRMPC